MFLSMQPHFCNASDPQLNVAANFVICFMGKGLNAIQIKFLKKLTSHPIASQSRPYLQGGRGFTSGAAPPIAALLREPPRLPGSLPSVRSNLSLQQIYGVEMSCKVMAAASWPQGVGGGEKAGQAKVASSSPPIPSCNNLSVT